MKRLKKRRSKFSDVTGAENTGTDPDWENLKGVFINLVR